MIREQIGATAAVKRHWRNPTWFPVTDRRGREWMGTVYCLVRAELVVPDRCVPAVDTPAKARQALRAATEGPSWLVHRGERVRSTTPGPIRPGDGLPVRAGQLYGGGGGLVVWAAEPGDALLASAPVVFGGTWAWTATAPNEPIRLRRWDDHMTAAVLMPVRVASLLNWEPA